MDNNTRALLKNHTVQDLLATLPLGELIDAPDNTIIEDALEMIAKENVLSIPVYQMHGKKQYISIVSSFDILAYVAFQPAFDGKDIDSEPPLFDYSGFLEHSIRELVGLSPESHSLYTILPTASLAELVTIFASKAHRVLVIPDQSAVRIITQKDLLIYLKNNLPQMSNYFSTISAIEFMTSVPRRIKEATKGTPLMHIAAAKGPVTITLHNTALLGFKKMFVYKVSAVAVVDDQGAIVGVLRASDLRGLERHMFDTLTKPVMTFLTKISPQNEPKDPYVLSDECTLAQCVEKLTQNNVQRIFFTDKNGLPVETMSLSHIVSAFEGEGMLVACE